MADRIKAGVVDERTRTRPGAKLVKYGTPNRSMVEACELWRNLAQRLSLVGYKWPSEQTDTGARHRDGRPVVV